MTNIRKSNNGPTIQNITSSKGNKKKKFKASDYYVIAIVIFSVLAVAIGIISANAPRNYYLKDIKILESSVVQKEQEDGKNYVKVSMVQADNVLLSEDNSWIEVNSDFYNKQMLNSQIGVKFVSVDIYSKNYWGLFANKGQTFEKNSWNIEEVYASKAEAEKANPTKKFIKQAIIEKKKITKLGDHFFVINSDQKSMPIMVEEEIYNKYNVNDSINCEFEAIGDLTKFIKITQ